MDIRDAQALAWRNKLRQGFNTTDVALEFNLLYGEVAEAHDAGRRGLVTYGEELADVFLYLVAIAAMTDIDLNEEVMAKIRKNELRTYVPGKNGVPTRVEGQ